MGLGIPLRTWLIAGVALAGMVVYGILVPTERQSPVTGGTSSEAAPSTPNATPEQSDAAPSTRNATPEQVETARSIMGNLRDRATVEESGSTLYVTFNYSIERDRIYKAAEIIVIADQVLGRTRYIHFYDPARSEIATFSPLTGLKVLEE